MSRLRLPWLGDESPPDAFPPIEQALPEPNGLLAAGGDLGSERLLTAYRRGIFPWYEDGQPILWWSPDPRCVLFPADLRVPRRLRQYARRSTFEISFNRQFGDVIRACAARRHYTRGTWITGEMIRAYERLHQAGWAHSIEVSDRDSLVGGLYGIAIGRVFFGESMFSAADNASKFALLGLASVMLDKGLEMLDCQVVSPHLLTLGATTIPRPDFLARLDQLCTPPASLGDWPDEPIPVRRALLDWQSAALQ